jgi:hypothetical protein
MSQFLDEHRENIFTGPMPMTLSEPVFELRDMLLSGKHCEFRAPPPSGMELSREEWDRAAMSLAVGITVRDAVHPKGSLSDVDQCMCQLFHMHPEWEVGIRGFMRAVLKRLSELLSWKEALKTELVSGPSSDENPQRAIVIYVEQWLHSQCALTRLLPKIVPV